MNISILILNGDLQILGMYGISPTWGLYCSDVNQLFIGLLSEFFFP